MLRYDPGPMPGDRNRRSIRLPRYDYTRPGFYFITLVTQNRAPLFGKLIGGVMRLNPLGLIVQREWLRLPERFPGLITDAHTVMPQHSHSVIQITETSRRDFRADASEDRLFEQFGKPVPGSIPTIVRAFKASVSFQIHKLDGFGTLKVWQRNYYESVIRDDRHLENVRRYIMNHPPMT